MQYQAFQYPLPTQGDFDDLNNYLRSNKVVNVTQHLVERPGCALLVFVVETVGGNHAYSKGRSSSTETKIDYREQFNDNEFLLFSKLRDLRKKIADAEGVPVYNIFTNAQLAAMVSNQVRNLDAIARIDGIGQARLEKYANYFVVALCAEEQSEPHVPAQ
jgi:superfamily II DNA helicase RecQ